MKITRRAFVKNALLASAAAGSISWQFHKFLEPTKRDFRLVVLPPHEEFMLEGARNFARLANEYSDRRINVEVLPSSEFPHSTDFFGMLRAGTLDMVYGCPGYWIEQEEAAQVFCNMPFGMNANELGRWIYEGGGQSHMDAVFNRHGVKSFVLGRSPAVPLWLNGPVSDRADLREKKIRLTGWANVILQDAGASAHWTKKPNSAFGSFARNEIYGLQWRGAALDLLELEATPKQELHADYTLSSRRASIFQVLLSDANWRSLPQPARNGIIRAAKEADEALTISWQKHELAALKQLSVRTVLNTVSEDFQREIRGRAESVLRQNFAANGVAARAIEDYRNFQFKIS